MNTDILKLCSCPLDATIAVIGGKYKLDIIYYLFDRTLRYSELAKLVNLKIIIQVILTEVLCVLI